MRAHIIDGEALASLRPREIRLYLMTHGWSTSDEGSEASGVWTHVADDETFEVATPSSTDARDYPQRVADLVSTLAVVEDRSELDVYRELARSSYDAQHIRRATTVPGMAPLGESVTAIRSAEQMLVAAANSLADPRALHPPQRTGEATTFIRRALLGGVTEGSQVLTILVPIAPRITAPDDDQLFVIEQAPRERQVTAMLHGAVAAAARAADRVNRGLADGSAFVDSVPLGVSANLIDALLGFAGDKERPFEIQFAWALDRPQDGPQSVRFKAEELPVLEAAASELRSLLPSSEVLVRGFVVRLHRDAPVLGSGDVSIAGVIRDVSADVRRITVSLAEADYAAAIDAHRDGLVVEVTGSLVRRGSRTYLTPAHGFRALPETLSERLELF